MKKSFLSIVFMMSSALLQGMNNDGSVKWQTLAAIAGVATVGGVAVWRATAPSDTNVLADINQKVAEKDLAKYNQSFDTKQKVADQESQLVENIIIKLGYQDQYQNVPIIKHQLGDDAQKLEKLKNSIWFRSYFNNDVAEKWNELDASQSNASNLQPYVQKHSDFFVGWSKHKEHSDYQQKMQSFCVTGQATFIDFIRRHHLGSKTYPLLAVTAKLLQDMQWVNKLKGSDYPKLKFDLDRLCSNFLSPLVLDVKNQPEYQIEEFLEKEELRKQAIADAQVKQARAQERLAQIESQRTVLLEKNVKLQEQRLKMAKAANERDRVSARVQELRRSGLTDREIQNQLNSEAFSRAVIGCFFDIG